MRKRQPRTYKQQRYDLFGMPIYLWIPLLPIILPLGIVFNILFRVIPWVLEFLYDAIAGELDLAERKRDRLKRREINREARQRVKQMEADGFFD